MSALDKDIVLLAELKMQKRLLESDIEEVQARVISELGAAGKDSQQTKRNGELFKATVVRASRIVIDPDRLKKSLGAPVWNKITKRVLDDSKLEDAMARGDIDPNTVASCSEEKFNKPYVKIS